MSRVDVQISPGAGAVSPQHNPHNLSLKARLLGVFTRSILRQHSKVITLELDFSRFVFLRDAARLSSITTSTRRAVVRVFFALLYLHIFVLDDSYRVLLDL
jgi:hypothetical protein